MNPLSHNLKRAVRLEALQIVQDEMELMLLEAENSIQRIERALPTADWPRASVYHGMLSKWYNYADRLRKNLELIPKWEAFLRSGDA